MRNYRTLIKTLNVCLTTGEFSKIKLRRELQQIFICPQNLSQTGQTFQTSRDNQPLHQSRQTKEDQTLLILETDQLFKKGNPQAVHDKQQD